MTTEIFGDCRKKWREVKNEEEKQTYDLSYDRFSAKRL